MRPSGDALIRFLRRPPRILLTNDDGIRAAGLLALKRALDPLGQVSVVAPDGNRSGAARSITMRAPLWVEEVDLPGGGRGYATDGTPVDCVRLAALGFLDQPPDLIVSGINHGGNLGDDITYSGTVAAAFEGIMLEIPAIAVSADGYHEGYDLSVPARVAARLVELALQHGFPGGTLLNVNCPDLPWDALRGVRLTTLGKRIYGDRVQLREDQGRRRRYFIYGDELSYHLEAGTDFEALADGFVSVTPVHFELTSHTALEQLSSWDFGVGGLADRGAAGSGTSSGAGAGGSPGASAPSGDSRARTGIGADPLLPPPAAVLFDLDGTVVDSVELIVQSFQYAVRKVLGTELPRDEIIRNVGRPLREQMLVVDEDLADDLVLAFREFNHREHERMLRLFPGMAELLLGLRAQRVRLGLVTSKSRMTTEMAFALTGIEPLFAAVVTADDTSRHKPQPEPLLRCLEQLGAGPEGAVYVGDSPWDLQAARAAGMRSVAVTWGVFPESTLCAESPDRLARTVEELRVVLGLAGGSRWRARASAS